ncbi:hypothetical protein T11_3952 [Trichinella zimbabwensis]|uniref:Uncharacterized protein n=1 Tax=Trichinella zimbabwensis TaxID=268475 RepID=A0A0V1HLT3_9BILA|nr:hypothetical protein T11_3952 [Trichinella zimbabwensis]
MEFITERAAWIRGYWERLIRCIKISLIKTLQKALVDEVGLRTILCETEVRLNSRPLTYLSSEPKDPEVLTPYHFLTGTKIFDLPEVNLKDEDLLLKSPTNYLSTLKVLQCAMSGCHGMTQNFGEQIKFEFM